MAHVMVGRRAVVGQGGALRFGRGWGRRTHRGMPPLPVGPDRQVRDDRQPRGGAGRPGRAVDPRELQAGAARLDDGVRVASAARAGGRPAARRPARLADGRRGAVGAALAVMDGPGGRPAPPGRPPGGAGIHPVVRTGEG
ncbi:MAG TPA: hypothetical protein VF122_03965 [Caulobacteraceae bacterium]